MSRAIYPCRAGLLRYQRHLFRGQADCKRCGAPNPDAKGIRFAERRAFCTELNLVKEKAMRLGLTRTFHALDAATTAVGWEVADYETGKRQEWKS